MTVVIEKPTGLDAAKAEARRLLDSARLHKRAQESHRKRVKVKYQELNELQAKWERHGVKLIEEADQPSPQRRPSDHQGSNQDTPG